MHRACLPVKGSSAAYDHKVDQDLTKIREHLDNYVAEVHLQAKAALQSLLRAKSSKSAMSAFQELTSFLGASANVSKLLWPSPGSKSLFPKETRQRGYLLREALGVQDAGNSLFSRELRNHFEHYDERLDQWAVQSTRHNLADRNLGPIGSIAGLETIDLQRQFNPAAMEVYFRDQVVPLEPMRQELERLVAVSEQKVTWLRYFEFEP